MLTGPYINNRMTLDKAEGKLESVDVHVHYNKKKTLKIPHK
ncbi:MAG: hypothetical protein PVF58_18800 [Candidatus Methanofastidiosia archaeon]